MKEENTPKGATSAFLERYNGTFHRHSEAFAAQSSKTVWMAIR